MADEQSIAISSSVPLLRSRQGSNSTESLTLRSTNALALLLNRAASGGGRPSTMVRETAVMQLEERRADWGYSKPVVALDIAWNLAFTIVSVVMLCSPLTLTEHPNTPIRVWIGGYALQCVVHVALVWIEYRRRRNANRRIYRNRPASSPQEGTRTNSSSSESDSNDNDNIETGGYPSGNNRSSFAKKCESLNTMSSFLWWIIGFYWIVSGGNVLLHRAPRLYWLAVVFLAFDVFFAIFCVALACIIGIALCCCLPCIIAILYAVAGQEGATESDLSELPKYKYQICTDVEKGRGGAGSMVPIGGEVADELVLLPEDAECCICLSSYENGAELNALPCRHHFHTNCIVKWLKINASCPLCKYNILKGSNGQA